MKTKRAWLSLLVLGWMSVSLYGFQTVDPFYKSLLDKAEQSFRRGRFEDSLQDLKIALFGLHPDPALKGRALVLMGLSHYYLGDREESRNALAQAVALLSPENIRNISLDEQTRLNLFNLFDLFDFPGYSGEATHDVDRGETEPEGPSADEMAVYQLFEVYLNQGNFNRARDILDDLIERRPEALEAHYRLGLLHYQRGRFRESLRKLTEYLEKSEASGEPEPRRLEARAFQLLAADQIGNRGLVSRLTREIRPALSENLIRGFSMTQEDEARLRRLLGIRDRAF